MILLINMVITLLTYNKVLHADQNKLSPFLFQKCRHLILAGEHGVMCKKILKNILVILLLIMPMMALASKADYVLVKKSLSKLYLLKKGKVLKEYIVSFGGDPKGHKEKEGDQKTPEGKYILDYKKHDSSFYKAIHVSYPNENDKKMAKSLGVSPGGQIMIHGQKNGFGWLSYFTQKFNWTDGCIAVENDEMDEIWNLVDAGTPIEIQP